MAFFLMEPEWVVLLAAALIGIFYVLVVSGKNKKKAAVKFSNIHLIKMASSHQKAKRRNTIILWLDILLVASLFLAMADPHIPLKQTKEGVNVVLALDISGSMQANDYTPTRLEAAKSAAKTLVESLDNKDYVGIITFSNGASTVSYLTPDKEKAAKRIEGISQNTGATAIGDGLSLAIDMVSSIPNKKKFVVLLSDGVSNSGVIAPLEAATFAKSSDVIVFTVGMGSEQPVVLGYDMWGRAQYAELDEATLKQIAAITSGIYFKSVDQGTLQNIYEKLPEKIEREKEPTSIKDWMIMFAILLIVSRFYLKEWKWRVLR